MKLDPHAAEEVIQIDTQLIAGSKATGNPDNTRQIDQLRLGGNQGDLSLGIGLAQFADGSQRRKAATDDGDTIHGEKLHRA